VEDVVYRDDGFFHFLTDEEHILASAPTFLQGWGRAAAGSVPILDVTPLRAQGHQS